MATTYLSLVNTAIQEAGVDLASFAVDGSDFVSQTDKMMNRFKVWVSRAWKEIQQEAYDWDFMQEQASVNIDPGFMFYTDGTAVSAFTASYPLNTPITIYDQDGTVAVTGINSSYVTDLTGNKTLTAPFGVMTLTSTNGVPLIFGLKAGADYILSGTNKGYVHSWKSFNFDSSEENQSRDFLEQVQELNYDSFRLVDFYKQSPVPEVPLTYVPWEVFRPQYDISSSPPGIPRIVTKDDVGRYRFYPHPYYTMTVKFDYIRTPQILTLFSDTVKGIADDFMDVIIWRAVQMYGEYDEQPSVVLRATKNYKNILQRLELKNRAKVHFRPHRMW